MMELNPELQQALDAEADPPPRLVDPRTKRAYVLLAAEQYDRIKTLLEQDDHLDHTYLAQMEAAMRAGWGGASSFHSLWANARFESCAIYASRRDRHGWRRSWTRLRSLVRRAISSNKDG